MAPFDVRLPLADEADDEIRNVVQPDISVVCDREKLDPRGCRGAPDWIIEILSPSTAAKDHIEKLALVRARRGPGILAGPSRLPDRDRLLPRAGSPVRPARNPFSNGSGPIVNPPGPDHPPEDDLRRRRSLVSVHVDAGVHPNRIRRLVSETKKFVTESCQAAAHHAMQVMGGIGYTDIFPVERIVRDLRLASIWTGTNEVMAMITASEWYREAGEKAGRTDERDVEMDAAQADAPDEKIYE